MQLKKRKPVNLKVIVYEYLPMDEYIFKQQLETAIANCKKILENTRNPQQPTDVSHTYNDKFHLAEYLTNTTLAAQLTILETLGITPELVKKFQEWSKTRSVTLRFSGEERCDFDRKVEREQESPTKYVTEIGSTTITNKVITKITEWFWKFNVSYEIAAYQGNSLAEKVVVRSRKSIDYEIKTSTDSTPKPKVSPIPSFEVNITWLFSNLNESSQLAFAINRKSKNCHTPRRNDDITTALSFANRLAQWNEQVENYFITRLFPVQTNHGISVGECSENIFIPVIPLFEEISEKLPKEESKGEESVIFSTKDVNLFLHEHRKSINEKFGVLERVFPDNQLLITIHDAKLVTINKHSQKLLAHYRDSIDYIESMLRNQLIAAIGKQVTPEEFGNYMIFHNRKLFKAAYEPRKFCYAIRRPDHYPEGILSIEANLHDGSISDPLSTIVKYDVATKPMNFSINAACNISFYGERYLHAWVGHEFSGQSGSSLNLVARARQFSSFIVLVGRIISANKFEPKYAIIIQNKDDLKIPLDLEQIPR